VSDAAIRAYGTAKRFSAATLDRWLHCGPQDRTEILRIVEQLRLGENQVRDLLDALQAIGARQKRTVAEILGDEAIAGVLSAGRARNETLHALKQALRRMRYPQLAATETRLRGLAKALGLPAGVTLSLPENLEGEEIVLSLRARSAAELRRRMTGTLTALGGAELDEIYRILGGEW
jgi:hypothetical protein